MAKLTRPPAETPPLYAQDGAGYEATVFAHYFVGGCDWWITEYDPSEDRAFGFVNLGDPQNAELGYIDLAELESVRAPVNVNGTRINNALPVEFDRYWSRVTLAEATKAVRG